MHELSIAQSIVRLVQQHLPAAADRKVKSVKVRIATDSLAFCFRLAGEGTVLKDATLEFEAAPGDELNVVEMELEE
jgi:hydrogenase nickel incorporation protein HypA/HybF